MPNWCSNHLCVSGDAAQVADLASKTVRPDPKRPRERLFDFNGILPMPEALSQPLPSCSSDELRWAQLSEGMRMSQIESLIGKDLYDRLEKKLSGTFVWAELQVGEINRRLKAFPELQGEIGLNPEAAALIMQNIERYGSPDWWHWCVSHWGTKWNAQDCCISLSDGLLEVSFETASSPPEGIYRAICAAYPNLHLEAKYIEEGMCFAGRYENEGAQLYDYPCSDEEYRAFAVEHFGCEFFDDDEDE